MHVHSLRLLMLSLVLLWGCTQSDEGAAPSPTPEEIGPNDSDGDGKADGPGSACPGGGGELAQVRGQRYGRTVVLDEFPSRTLGNTRRVTLYLPEAYDREPERRFPVLYMHDGQNLFDPARSSFGTEWRVDETVDWLIAEGIIEPLIVVGVDNTWDRMGEYTPSFDPDFPEEGGRGPAYADFLVHEVKPWVDAAARTRCGANDTGLVGSSLGGLISLYILQRHPGVFGRVGCVSSSFWWKGGEAFEWAAPVLEQWQPGARLWLDAGTEEGNDSGTEDGANLDPDGDGVGYMVGDARRMRDLLLEGGLEFGDELGYFEHQGADHSEGAWAARLHQVLAFLWAPRPLPGVGAIRAWSYGDRIQVGQHVSVVAETAATAGPVMTLPPAWLEFRSSDPSVASVDEEGMLRGEGPGVAQIEVSFGELHDTLRVEVRAAPSATVTLSFQVTVPASTPAVDTVWLAGSLPELGDWSPAGFPLVRGEDGRWYGELVLPRDQSFAYKVTRGSWETVEKTADGEERADRQDWADADKAVELWVARWADEG